MREIPAVEKILQALGPIALPRPVVVTVVREELARLRRTLQRRATHAPTRGPSGGVALSAEAVITRVRRRLDDVGRSRLQPVVNGTGILIHTNLGRAPLGRPAVEAIEAIAAGYCNLEFDLASGQRGSRAGYLEHALALLCGAPAAAVVNNCAAALVLVLRNLTAGDRKQVIVSRGELIQIGGGFRIPEILESSGAQLREVGTTNRTTAADYARALGPDTALLLKVHRSNFFMSGFVESPPTRDLVALARRRRVPLVEDLGSGAVIDTAAAGVGCHEPTPTEELADGVDLVCFSGDKLLGGPQAGVIAGRARLVAALKRDPFFRALRCDKLVFAALQTTVDAHLTARGASAAPAPLPLLEQLRASPDALRARAKHLAASLAGLPLSVDIGRSQAQVGGGTLPQAELESVSLAMRPQALTVREFAARLREGTPPVIGYIANGRWLVDLRTVFPHQDAQVSSAIRRAFE